MEIITLPRNILCLTFPWWKNVKLYLRHWRLFLLTENLTASHIFSLLNENTFYTSLSCTWGWRTMASWPYDGVGVQLQLVRCDALLVLLKQVFEKTLETSHRAETELIQQYCSLTSPQIHHYELCSQRYTHKKYRMYCMCTLPCYTHLHISWMSIWTNLFSVIKHFDDS